MKKQTKSKLILYIILIALALTGVIHNEFSLKHIDKNQNLKNDVISDLRNAVGVWDPPITKSVGDYPFSVFIGDANNDGYNDIATANYGSNDISILLWNSISGDWDSQITKSVGDYPFSVFIGDANNDGYNDIVTANYLSGDVSIFLWNSTSEDWGPQILRFLGIEPFGVFIGDANNDGYNDVVTANIFSDNVSILIWNSSLEDWDPQITKSVGIEPSDVFIGDINNDGYNDIATANSISDDVSILLWNSTSGNWDSQITKAVGDGPFRIFIGDTNNDGYNDIATPNYYSDDISILLWNSTSGDWDSQITKAVGDSPHDLFIGDASNDGYNDIATANYYSNDVSILLWNSTSDDWNSQITKAVGDSPVSIFIGDANNDGFNDIATANELSNDISIILWKSIYISIISPENKTYGPLKGYYPATYGFDNDENGSDPKGWVIFQENPEAEVISELDGHKKVLRLNDTVGGSGNPTRIYNNFTKKDYGTVEVWIQQDDLGQSSDRGQITGMGNDSIIFGVRMWGGTPPTWKVRDNGTEVNIIGAPTPSPNTWYHIRIDFEHTSGGYQGLGQNEYYVHINGIRYGPYLFETNISIEELHLHTYSYGSGYNVYFDAVGYSWDSAYEVSDNLNEGMRLSFSNSSRLDWIAYSLDGQDNITIFEQEIIPLPEDGPHSIQVFGRDAELGAILESEIRYFTVDTISPEIIIQSPFDGEAFGCIAPKYNISLIEANLESIWYTIDGGITNFTINKLSGYIDHNAWFSAPNGPITLRFYAKDVLNKTNYEEVVITKTKLLSIDIINQSFSSSDFKIELFVYNESGEAIDFASIQMWWNGVDVSADIQNFGNGLYFVSLEPITVAPSEDPILLNMTISATGYADKYFETYIAVHPSDVVEDTLDLEIVDQSFSGEKFDITFFIHNNTGYGIDFATFQIWWNGVDVSTDVQNLGNGYYFISLVPITVALGEDPILLNMTISATEYEDIYFETYIAVRPSDLVEDTLDLEIVDQSFSTEEFNITFLIHNTTGAGIDFATFQIWWNGVDVSADVQNLGNGYYFISLEPITVVPGEDPIQLSITISATGYVDKYFDIDIAVDPASLQKGEGEPTEEFPLFLIIIISAVSAGVIIGLVSILWLRKRKREPQ